MRNEWLPVAPDNNWRDAFARWLLQQDGFDDEAYDSDGAGVKRFGKRVVEWDGGGFTYYYKMATTDLAVEYLKEFESFYSGIEEEIDRQIDQRKEAGF